MMRSPRSSVFLTLSLVLPACSVSVDPNRPPGGDTPPTTTTTTGGLDTGTTDTGTGGDTGDENEDVGDGPTGDDSSTGDADDQDTGDTGDADTGDTGDETDTDTGDTGDTDDVGDTGTGDTGGDTDDGDTDTDTGTQPPEPCQVSDNQVMPVPPNIMLILDKSGSMYQETWDHDGDTTTAEVTRWTTLHGAVSRLTANFEDRVKFGAKLYPQFNAGGFSDQCLVTTGVEVPCALNNSAAVISGIPLAGAMVQGGTPMQSGLDEGIAYLESLPAEEPKVALLVADGAISCDESLAGAVTTVTDAAAADIPTYVIGIDPDEDDPNATDDTYDQLTELANAGGRPNANGPPAFFPVQNEADLDAVMEQIISESLQCVVNIDPVPEFPELFEVWVGMNEVPLITDCATEAGWHWTVEHSQIEFCNMACVDLNVEGSMEGKYFCEVE